MFSIIIPAYNCVNTLDRCVNSIIRQVFNDYELLLVDDGSCDGTAEICDSFAAQDSRIRVFHKNNGGVSSARNMGLDNANGEWVLFLDSDDEFSEDSLLHYAQAIEGLDRNLPELILANMVYVHNDRSETVVYGENINSLEMMYKQRLWGSVWNKLFSKVVIDKYHIRFDESIHLSEDYLFVAEYCSHVSELKYISAPCYYQYAPEISYSDKYKEYISFSNNLRVYSRIKEVNPFCSRFMVDGLIMSLFRELKLIKKGRKETISRFKDFVGRDIKYSLGRKKFAIRALSHSDSLVLWQEVLVLSSILHLY